MEFLTKNKLVTAIAAAAILVLAYFAVNSFAASPALSSSDTAPSPISQQMLTTLADLHTIRLDGSIFSDPVFVSLADFGVTIPPEATGRRNPFLPVNEVPSNTTVTKSR